MVVYSFIFTGKFTTVHPLAMSIIPLVDEMKASLQRERAKGIHPIPKSMYLEQLKLTLQI